VLKGDPRYAVFHDEALKIISARDRIPAPELIGDAVYNFWQDADHVRGVWRRTTAESYATPDPQWETVLDLDKLAADEKANWVWHGANCPPPEYRRCLVTLSNGGEDQIMIRMVADFPDFIPFPLPAFAGNIQLSNPFQLLAVENTLYVTDGGRNLVWQIDLLTGSFSALVNFPRIPNPLFGIVPAGGPFLDAVPTGIAVAGDQLLVTLFRGVPFPPGTSTVEQVDPLTGSDTAFITGLKTAIDILPIATGDGTSYLVLEHASIGPFFGSPGRVLRFDTPAGPPTVIANCLTRPTTMTLDRKAGTLYVSEYGGRIVAIPFVP